MDSRGGHNRYNFDTDFFKKWTSKMAYVLGFLYADGNITDATKSSRTQYIKFSSKDKSILEAIKKTLKSNHPISFEPPREIIHKNGVYTSAGLFNLRIGSKKMFSDLRRIGITPNKSKIIEFPVDLPDEYLGHFVRGYFDGDGCISFWKKGNVVKILSIIFTSGSHIFLEKLGRILKNQLELKHEKVYKTRGAFQLRYSTNDTIKIFKLLYKGCCPGLYLERKFDIFNNYFELSPQKIDAEIASVLIK